MQALITHRPRQKKIAEVSTSQSWGEDIQKYQTQKTQVPWSDKEQQPVKHITRYEKSREEREYDPILGKLRDLEKESFRAAQSARLRTASISHAKAKQQRYMQKFNLINHRAVGAVATADSEDTNSIHRPPNTRVGYDLISNVDLPTERRPHTIVSTRGSGRAVKYQATQHGFSILTNKYLERHDEKEQQDRQEAKARAEEKFWKTHDYNALVGSYYDSEKEERFVRERDEKRKTHGVDRIDKLPDSVQYSEGRSFNIINKQVIDKRRFTRLSNKQNRSINNKNATQVEQRLRAEADSKAKVIDKRAINRISYVRQIEPYKKGYDIVTMQPYIGRTRKFIAPIQQKPQPDAWEKLKIQSDLYRGGTIDATFRDLSGKPRPGTTSTSRTEAQVLVIRRGTDSSDNKPAGTEFKTTSTCGSIDRPQTVAATESSLSTKKSIPALQLEKVRTGGF